MLSKSCILLIAISLLSASVLTSCLPRSSGKVNGAVWYKSIGVTTKNGETALREIRGTGWEVKNPTLKVGDIPIPVPRENEFFVILDDSDGSYALNVGTQDALENFEANMGKGYEFYVRSSFVSD